MSEKLKKIEDLFANGEAQKALEQLEDFLAAEPENIRAINDLGAIHMSLGDSAQAVAAFEKALNLNPSDQTARTNLVLAFMATENWPQAKEHLNKLLAQNQNQAHLWALLAKAEKSMGNPKAALDFIDRSLHFDPNQPKLIEVRKKLHDEASRAPLSNEIFSKPLKSSVLMCCQTSLEHFANQLCDELEKSVRIKRAVVDNFASIHWPLKSADTVWLEWGSDLAIQATNEPGLLAGKKVILRLHSYEILSNLAAQINY
ncbi:MAG: tetratricopeptide repeat protein, partial [Candidatus Adiutrix sp.]